MRGGGCRCGAVRYRVDGPLRDVLVCHCNACRAAAGGPWAATASHRTDLALVESGGLRWHRAASSEHGASRGICDRCRMLVFWDAPARATVSIGVESLDDPSGLEVAGHLWVTGANGLQPAAGAPSFAEGLPPGVDVAWRREEPEAVG